MSTTIDAAIIKALVEHVGGDSSGIPNGTIGGKTYTAGDGIDITNDAISVKYDEDTMELKDGKLAVSGDLSLTKNAYRVNLDYGITNSKALYIPGKATLTNIGIGSYIMTNSSGVKKKWILIDKPTDTSCTLLHTGGAAALTYDSVSDHWSSVNLQHTGEITEEYGLFLRGQAPSNGPTEVVPADEYRTVIAYIIGVLNTKANKT